MKPIIGSTIWTKVNVIEGEHSYHGTDVMELTFTDQNNHGNHKMVIDLNAAKTLANQILTSIYGGIK